MLHAVNFINCHVSTVFAYRDADGNVVHKRHHKVSSRVSKLFVVDHQGEQDGANDSSLKHEALNFLPDSKNKIFRRDFSTLNEASVLNDFKSIH